MAIERIFDFHTHQYENYPSENSLVDKVNGEWKAISTAEFLEQARKLSTGLLKLGVKPGDKIAMVSNNRSEWHITDLAILQIGAVNVPIYPTITAEDYEFILKNSESRFIFISDKELYDKIAPVKEKVENLEELFTFNEVEGAKNWKSLLEDEVDADQITSLSSKIKSDDLATLIYTSGTTGTPKGVMLSHKNLVSNVLASNPRLPCTPHSRALSFLPLCHVYERMVAYLYIYKGVSIYYAESLDTIGDNLKEVKPQVFTAVPRLLEKIYDKIVAKGKELSGIKKSLFFWAIDLGLKYDVHKKGLVYNLQLSLANKLIFSKWREALGGNALAIASGSAALQPRLARVFLAARIPVMEGYGLTETSPVIAVNCEENDGVRIGTVGKPLENVEVKIAEDGEILVKGPNVMMGYYKNEEATKGVFDDEGWFHTGDIGEFTNEGFLKITDRKKEIFKTSGGKYIAPQLMENKFKESLFIEQLMVIGEGQKHPAAIIQPSFEYLESYCKKNKIAFKTHEDLIQNPKVVEQFQKEVDRYNEFFAQYEKIKKFEICPLAWTIAGGEITPTLKLKRKEILKKYKHLYDRIYQV